MEATGIYYEQLAYHLNKLNKKVSVLLPNKVSHYSKSLNVKTKTDQVDAQIIAIMSCDPNLFPWTPPSPLFKKLRSICRLYKTLQYDKTQAINRLKQLECGYDPLKEALKIHKSTIKRIKKQLNELEGLMEETLMSDEEVWSKVKKLLSIKGQTKISKKGISNIRSAMHFPSMVATRYNAKMKTIYERILAKKKVKKIGLIAIQKRWLVLMYALWRTNQPFIEYYKPEVSSGFHEE
jgi:transposase